MSLGLTDIPVRELISPAAAIVGSIAGAWWGARERMKADRIAELKESIKWRESSRDQERPVEVDPHVSRKQAVGPYALQALRPGQDGLRSRASWDPRAGKPMTIFVTGSAGHLGEALIRSVRAAGESVFGLDRKSSPFTERIGSICDKRFVEGCMERATAVVHAATLHKPHVATHSWQDFIDTNVTGTLILLEAAIAAGVKSFIYVSTTSVFGSALAAAAAANAVWVTEDLAPTPKNIYGATKLMAENLCELAHRKHRLPIVVLRTSRFFPEEDDDPNIRRQHGTANVQANEMLYRRVDIADAVSAVFLALQRASDIGFARYIISATTPFRTTDLPMLWNDAPSVVHGLFPDCQALFGARGWKLFPRIDRVYVNDRARTDLGWMPKYDFAYLLECLRSNRDFGSPLAREVGSKGYHDRTFAEGPYPVE